MSENQQISFECPVCYRSYAEKDVNPTTYHCGHSVCMEDARVLTQCPICSVPAVWNENLKVNYQLKEVCVIAERVIAEQLIQTRSQSGASNKAEKQKKKRNKKKNKKSNDVSAFPEANVLREISTEESTVPTALSLLMLPDTVIRTVCVEWLGCVVYYGRLDKAVTNFKNRSYLLKVFNGLVHPSTIIYNTKMNFFRWISLRNIKISHVKDNDLFEGVRIDFSELTHFQIQRSEVKHKSAIVNIVHSCKKLISLSIGPSGFGGLQTYEYGLGDFDPTFLGQLKELSFGMQAGKGKVDYTLLGDLFHNLESLDVYRTCGTGGDNIEDYGAYADMCKKVFANNPNLKKFRCVLDANADVLNIVYRSRQKLEELKLCLKASDNKKTCLINNIYSTKPSLQIFSMGGVCRDKDTLHVWRWCKSSEDWCNLLKIISVNIKILFIRCSLLEDELKVLIESSSDSLKAFYYQGALLKLSDPKILFEFVNVERFELLVSDEHTVCSVLENIERFPRLERLDLCSQLNGVTMRVVDETRAKHPNLRIKTFGYPCVEKSLPEVNEKAENENGCVVQ